MGVIANRKPLPRPAAAPQPVLVDVKAVMARQAQRALEERAPHTYAEIKRITGLPVSLEITPEELEAYCEANILADAFQGSGDFAQPFRLWGPQASIPLFYEMGNGAFGGIGVGFGKTLASIMVAQKGYEKGLRKSLLLIPSRVHGQFWGTSRIKGDLAWARARVHLSVPFHTFHKRSAADRLALAKSNKKGCYVCTYSLASRQDFEEILRTLAPELLIVDEAHYLGRKSARRDRVERYVGAYEPDFVAFTGSVAKKKLEDFAHLVKWALRDNSPLPHSSQMLEEWGYVLNAGASPSEKQSGPIKPLIEWARRSFPKEKITPDVTGFRKAFRLRLVSAPGVVSTGDNVIPTTLSIENVPVPNYKEHEDWPKLEQLIHTVDEEWRTPSGDEIEHAIHCFKWLYELTAGFYYDLFWPTKEKVAERRQVSEGQAEDFLVAAKDHHAAQQDYARALREWLKEHGQPGLDTPLLVASDLAHGGHRVGSPELLDLWRAMKAIERERVALEKLEAKKLLVRDSRSVRVCDYKIKHALAWALENKLGNGKRGALVWCYHKEVARWAHEVFVEAGLDAILCTAGQNDKILDPANGKKIIVASMSAHGEGKNLQHFQEQIFIQWPRGATMAEQTLGRTHRSGQEADELVVRKMDTIDFDLRNFAACLNDATFVHQTLANRQKIVYANYEPAPVAYPSEWLQERGFQTTRLNAEARKLLREKFDWRGEK